MEKWQGIWTMRNGRKIKFTSDPKEMLMDISTFPSQLFDLAWDDNGNSKIDANYDLFEREREAKGKGMNL